MQEKTTADKALERYKETWINKKPALVKLIERKIGRELTWCGGVCCIKENGQECFAHLNAEFVISKVHAGDEEIGYYR